MVLRGTINTGSSLREAHTGSSLRGAINTGSSLRGAINTGSSLRGAHPGSS